MDHGIIYTVFGSLTNSTTSMVPKVIQDQDDTKEDSSQHSEQDIPTKWYRIVGGGSRVIQSILSKLGEVDHCTILRQNSDILPHQHTVQKGFRLLTSHSERPDSKARTRPSQRILRGKRVCRISYDKPKQSLPMKVGYNDTNLKEEGTKLQHELFDAVISSTTLGALQTMDLTELNLPYSTQIAIRSINYSGATKVAIKFKTAWWAIKIMTREGAGVTFDFRIEGGIGKTDLPIRNW